MPVIKSLTKITKNLSKSKSQGLGLLHVKGRKFKQINRATLRDQKISNKKTKHQELVDQELLGVKFIQEAVRNRPEQATFTLDEMKLFVESYISRFDEELAELQEKRRPGRPASSRQLALEDKVKKDKHVYETGFRVPNLTDKPTVDRLRLWTGSSGGTTVMKFVLIHKGMDSLPTGPDVDMES